MVRDDAALAWVDISTGAFHVTALPPVRVGPALARLMPAELLINEAVDGDLAETVSESGAAVTPISRASFDSAAGEKRLTSLFGVGSLEAYGQFTRAEISAMGSNRRLSRPNAKGKLRSAPPLREAEARDQ